MLNLDQPMPVDYHPRVVAMTKHSVRHPTVHPFYKSEIRLGIFDWLKGSEKRKRMHLLTRKLTSDDSTISNSLILSVASKGVGRKSRTGRVLLEAE